MDIKVLFGIFFCCVTVETRASLALGRNLSEALFITLKIVLLLEV